MQVMRGGGSATDAVEIAIKILEDREVTNAGYGSNLAMDGVVECDAVIVDQHGRSGACGAVARKINTCFYLATNTDANQKSRTPSASRDSFWIIPRRSSASAVSHQTCSLVKVLPTLPLT